MDGTGKTNPEIGMILGLSPRTVQKHIEFLYQPL
jgi:DNA-binding CsgD family transcriptional regulator